MGAAARLHRGQDSAAVRQLAVEDLRPLGQVPRQHVRDRVRGPVDGAEADELPGALPAVLAAAPLLPRPAGALLRAGAAAPPRAQRHAARTAARSPLRPGRRSHLLHRGADPGRGQPAAWSSRSRPMRCSASTSGWSSRRVPRSASAPTSMWDRSRERRWRSALESTGLEYDLNEGDGAFYGPKIDLHMTDSLGRSWQLGTVQLDYNMPERFGLSYTGADNAEHRPVMIHRALMGSYERFIGILLEHLEGELPGVAGAGAGDRAADRRPPHRRTPDSVVERLQAAGRAGRGRRPHRVDRAQDPRRRAAQDPVHAVVGDREQDAGEVALREHRTGDEGSSWSVHRALGGGRPSRR